MNVGSVAIFIVETEVDRYEDSLKYYRDLKNSFDTAREEGREEEKMRIARELLRSGVAVPVVAGSTGLAEEQVRVLEGEID
jgi:predicted transposase/invertase (TIGR01784 family)